MWPRGCSSPPSAYAWHARDSGAPVWPVENVEMPQGPRRDSGFGKGEHMYSDTGEEHKMNLEFNI